MDDNDPNYLIWFLVIFFAVTLGSLTSNYVTAKIAEYHLMTAAGEAARQMEGIARRSAAELQDAQRRSAEQRASQSLQERQARIGSPTGRKLAQACNEWTQTHSQLRSSYAEMEKNRRCAQLQHYIDTGSAP